MLVYIPLLVDTQVSLSERLMLVQVSVLYTGLLAEISSPFKVRGEKKHHDSSQIYLLYILLDLLTLILSYLLHCTYLDFFQVFILFNLIHLSEIIYFLFICL